MDCLSLDEIIYITRFLNLKNTFNFLKSLKMSTDPFYHNSVKNILVKNKKLMVIENIYKSFFEEESSENHHYLKELLCFFYRDIEVEDLICFMANVYPNFPHLRDTILFDLLKLYKFSRLDWNLVKVHFKTQKMDFVLVKV